MMTLSMVSIYTFGRGIGSLVGGQLVSDTGLALTLPQLFLVTACFMIGATLLLRLSYHLIAKKHEDKMIKAKQEEVLKHSVNHEKF